MQLVKLIVELSNHLLNICTFFLRVNLLEHCDLHVLLGEEPLLQQGEEWFLLQHVLDLSVTVAAQLRGVRLVNLVDHLRIEEQRR